MVATTIEIVSDLKFWTSNFEKLSLWLPNHFARVQWKRPSANNTSIRRVSNFKNTADTEKEKKLKNYINIWSKIQLNR